MEEGISKKKRNNTFKFQGFNDHKERIKIALLRNQLFPIQLESDTDTKCAASLVKWTDLNATAHFTTFRRDVEMFVQSLELLVLHKDDVITTFKEALAQSPLESLQPITEFGVALCLDLSEAMQSEFGALVGIYTGLLSRHASPGSSPQALEHAFTGLSYTMYAMRRQLRRRPEAAAAELKPLLLTGGHVTELAAESLAFLLRKLPQQQQQARILAMLADWLAESASVPETSLTEEAVSAAVFFWLRGAAGQLVSSQFEAVYPHLLDWLGGSSGDAPAARLRCLALAHVRILGHLRRAPDAALEPIRCGLLDRLAGAADADAAGAIAELATGLLDIGGGDGGGLLAGGQHCERWCRRVEELLARLPGAWSERLSRLVAGLVRRAAQVDLRRRLFRCGYPAGDWRRRLEFACLAGESAGGDCLEEALPELTAACVHALQQSGTAEAEDAVAALHRLGAFCVANCPRVPAEAFVPMPSGDRGLDWAQLGAEDLLLVTLTRMIDRLGGSFQGNSLALYCSFLPYSNIRHPDSPSALSLWQRLIDLLVGRLSRQQPAALNEDDAYSLLRCVYALLCHPSSALALQLSSRLLPAVLQALGPNASCPLYWKTVDFLCEVVGVDAELDWHSTRDLALGCLTSGSHSVRLHCLRLLSRLLPSSTVAADVTFARCLGNCLAAESLPVGVESLRDCLRLLEELNAERISGLTEAASSLSCRYLLGLLRVQFTPLWSPIARLLAGHAASGSGGAAFWAEMAPVLEAANAAAAAPNVATTEVAMETEDGDQEEANSCLREDAKRLAFGISTSNLERIDPTTYRLQLWQCLRLLPPQLTSKRTGVTSPLMLSSLRCEFCANPRAEPWTVRRRCQATLVTMLDLYSGLGKAIKCVSGEAELHRWYYDLLQCPGAKVRKAALRCILAYGDRALMKKPAGAASGVDWVAFLNRLADWHSTKDALVSIGSDLNVSDGGVDDRQRQAVLAVAMRLLLGRVRSGGGGQLQCVFSFLADSCRPEERRTFLSQLLFDQFSALSLESVDSVAIDEAVAIGRLQAAAKCALLVLGNMHLDSAQLCQLYTLLLCFNALLPRLAETAGSRGAGGHAMSQLKGFRKLCQRGVLRAFETNCQLPEQLVAATFKYCVQPQLEKLSTEAATASTPSLGLCLMRLWSADNRHDHLLEGAPVRQLARLLESSCSGRGSSRCTDAALLATLAVLNNLAEAQLPDAATDEQHSHQQQKLARPHYLAPVADSLAAFVSHRLAPGNLEASPEVSRETLRLLALLVDNGLYRTDLCEQLAGAVLQLLLIGSGAGGKSATAGRAGRRRKFLRDDDFQARLLGALLTLLRRADTPCRAQFLQSFTLFSKLTHRSSRMLLCQIADEAVRKLGLTNQPLGELADDLNAWDKRHVDSPDFVRRERGHSAASAALLCPAGGSGGALASWPGLLRRQETALVALHCALHTLACVSDGPLRLLASELLHGLVGGLGTLDRADPGHEARPRLLNLLLWRSVWPAVAQGVKMDETRRVEYIGILGKVVSEFGHHARLRPIAPLAVPAVSGGSGERDSNHPGDTFFDNVRSVNTARVVKGFRQLISFLAGSQGGAVPPALLYNYLLPLPMHYLRAATRGSGSAKQASRRSLVESGLELLAGISARLPWQMLRQLLKFCLRGLDGPLTESKLPIRMAVSALSGLGEIADFNADTVETLYKKKLQSRYVTKRGKSSDDRMEVDADADADTLERHQPAEALVFLTEFVCPKLERHLARDKTATEQQHRLAPRQEPQVLQVSVAVALAQLLAKLPRRMRDQRLPRLIYRLADFLRSREHAVRKEAGATLVRVVQLLGNEYVGFVARELNLLLARGYTRHVLAHTLHVLLRHCQQGMPNGCLDGETLERLCRIYMDELLGDLSKEKEVEALTRKLPEAQRVHAYSVLHRLGGLVGPAGLAQLTGILSGQCASVRSVAALRKLERVCVQLERADSLPGNACLTPEHLLTAAHLLCKRAAASGSGSAANASSNRSRDGEAASSREPDSRLLDPEPGRGETRPAQLGSYHVLLRFGLRLLYAVLRNSGAAAAGSKSRAGATNGGDVGCENPQGADSTHGVSTVDSNGACVENGSATLNAGSDGPAVTPSRGASVQLLGRRMLDPFVPILLEALDSQHTAVLTAALQCLSRLVPLHQLAAAAAESAASSSAIPNVGPLYRQIAKRVLALFNEQSLLWATRQQLQQPSQLQQLLHRTLAVLVRNEALQQADLVTLVDYIALDVESPHRASHAFPLLKAILAKRLNPKPQRRHELDVDTERDHASLSAIMDSVRRLAITSALDYVRAQSRDCLLVYLRDYRLPAKIVRRHLDFFLVQLDYEADDGRSSAVQTLSALVHCMSLEWLRGDFCQLLFLRLLVACDSEVNDQLRARITDCLHGLLRRCGPDQRRELFASALRLLRANSAVIKQQPRRQLLTQWRLGLTAALAFFEFDQLSPASGAGSEGALDRCWATAELRESLLDIAENLAATSQAEPAAGHGEDGDGDDNAADREAADHALFRCVDMLARVLTPNSAADSADGRRLGSLMERLLGHRFAWVQRRCLQLVTARMPPMLDDGEQSKSDAEDEKERYRRLALACFDQLKSAHLDEDWATDIGQLLVHLCCRMRRLEAAEGRGDPPGESAATGFTAQWLLLRLGRESQFELQHLRPSTLRRRLALKVCAGVFAVLGSAAPAGCLRRALAVAARELRQQQRQQRDPDVLDLAHALLDACRHAVGESAVSAGLAHLERSRASARSARVGQLSAAAVTQPELFAQRKRRKQRKKVESAKAKLAKFKATRRGLSA